MNTNTTDFSDYDEQSQDYLKGLKFLDLDALQKGILGKDPFEGIRSSKSFEEISNQYALNSPFGKNSVIYTPMYISENINFEKLIEIIVANKDILFNYEDYIGYDTKKVRFSFFNDPEGAKVDKMYGNSTSYDGYETYKTEIPLITETYSGEKVLDLKGKINTSKEVVNISKDNVFDDTAGYEFEFDYNKKIVSYKRHQFYVGKARVFEKYNTQNNIAFTISTSDYQDFIAFQKLANRKYLNTDFETEIATAFLNAIKKVSELQDMTVIDSYTNKKTLNVKKLELLDWLYENIPPFVAEKLNFDQTIENVFKLSHYDKGSFITDTTKSITTVLSRLDSKTVYRYFNSNPQKLIDLLSGFSDDALVENFCNYLTALTFIYLQPDVSKARKFNLSENTHIETNILYGDKNGKVELVNELQLPSVGFNALSLLNLLNKDIEINNPNKESNQFHPLELIYITHFDEQLKQEIAIPTIALYAKYLGDKEEWSDVVQASIAVFDVFSIIVSGGALSAGIRGTARLIAIIDITVSTINLALLNNELKNQLNKTEAGRWFVAYWPIISLCVGVGTISYYLAKGILKYGKQVSQQLQNEEKLAGQIDELVEESEKVADEVDELEEVSRNYKIDNFIERNMANGKTIGKIAKEVIVRELHNVTETATQVSRALRNNEIKLIKLDEKEFYDTIKEYGETLDDVKDVLASQKKNIIYIKNNTSLDKAFGEIVHEGKHALDHLDGLFKNEKLLREETKLIVHDKVGMKSYVDKMTKNQVIELRARIAEREFQIAAKQKPDFSSVAEMISFIFKKYYL